jgi:predicted ATPase/DNA-binding winged helix-turn-helix (wHTH) protein
MAHRAAEVQTLAVNYLIRLATTNGGLAINARDLYPRPTVVSAFVAGRSEERPRIYVSGDLEIDCARRELRVRESAVPIGTRAFEILEVLVRSAGELITKDELMSRVWSKTMVEDNTLVVHISAIRRALGANRGILKTASGRGYRLGGTWAIREETASVEPDARWQPRTAAHPFRTNIPVAASALIGRETSVQHLRDLLSAYRVVTLRGPGGIGKTVLATEVARRLFATLESDVLLVELASLSDPGLVPSAVASVIGLQLGGDVISAETVARALGDRRILFVLDNCEHLINEAAALTETMIRACPGMSVLATSREILRIEGELVYDVPPLDVPPQRQEESASLLEHSAVQLFLARAKAMQERALAEEEHLPLIAAICRHLDGIPLALEFAAARTASLGIQAVAEHLDNRFELLTTGRRTALPRHQTLRATLDWSYDLLPEVERRLLRHLAIFPGGFTLEAAAAVMRDGSSAQAIIDGISRLVEKSLVTLERSVSASRWRLLETIRAYALQKLAESGERDEAARRHAEFFRDLFADTRSCAKESTGGAEQIDNVRAALEWSFSPSGEVAIGVALVVAAAPVFLTMSLVAECHRWSERALLALDAGSRGGREEMHLQTSLGTSLMHMYGQSETARVALNKSLSIAEQYGDVLGQIGLLGMLHMFHLRGGDFRNALDCAKRGSGLAEAAEDPAAVAFAQSMLGRSLHVMGELDQARAALEASLQHWSQSQRTIATNLASDHPYRAGIALARTLWLEGHPAQALECAQEAIQGAEQLGHTVSLMVVLAWAASVFLWAGDLESAEQHIGWFTAHAESHSVAPFVAVGRCHTGALSIARGDAARGVKLLRAGLEKIHATRYELLTTEFNTALVHGLASVDRFSEGIALIDETIRLADANGDVSYMPELLRTKGRLLVSMPRGSADEADVCFRQALDLSRRLGTRGWELRIAVDLAELLSARLRPESARALLEPVLAQFTEGFDTSDLRAAERLLSTLG